MTPDEPPFLNPDLSAEQRASDLLSRLSAEEKISQMLHDAPRIDRLGIPRYNWWNECLHGVARAGVATVFPQAIGLAATFNSPLVYVIAEVISDEARAKHHAHAQRADRGMYKGLTYWTPNINLFRDPRWGRGQETYGECPYLTGRLGVAFVKGIQGDNPKYTKVVATPKHFAVHSGPEKERHRFNATVSPKDLRESYLPAFRDCVVEAKAHSIMGAYNRTNDEPCCASQLLLGDILRGEWGFAGYVVSDCGALEDFHRHHQITARPEESAALALRHGCDLNCGQVYGSLLRALEQGLITQKEIDRSLHRLLVARFRLGMFDPPERVPYAQIAHDKVNCEEHRALARRAAWESIVLLKNQNSLLPLPRDVRSLAVIGPNADDRQVLLGNYHGLPDAPVTLVEGIRRAVSPGTRVLYQPGCEHIGIDNPAWGRADKYLVEAELAAERADAVVLCLGITGLIEGEEGDSPMSDSAGDRLDIGLPAIQQVLLERIVAVGKPVVLVLLSGSALAVPWAHRHVPAILQQFYPGQEGGTALADVLIGKVSPAGRLPVTVYESVGHLPAFEDYAMEGRTYRFFRGTPLYPFGFGLSYTQFSYTNLDLGKGKARVGEPVTLRVDIENVGKQSSDEVAQVYLSHESPSVRAPIRQLAGFQRVHLPPGEKTTLEFTLQPRQMALVDDDGSFFLEAGRVTVSVGGSQPDPRSLSLGAGPPVQATLVLSGKRILLDP